MKVNFESNLLYSSEKEAEDHIGTEYILCIFNNWNWNFSSYRDLHSNDTEWSDRFTVKDGEHVYGMTASMI